MNLKISFTLFILNFIKVDQLNTDLLAVIIAIT